MPSSTAAATSSIAVVTGAAGYVGGQVMAALLRKGYTVRGTVRSKSDEKARALLKDFPAVQLYEADLLQEGSFDRAIDGARFVFHVASPAKLSVEDGQRDLIDPAVKGTTTVVTSALRAASVERIILTSSVITLLDPSQPAGRTYDESDWNLSWPLAHAPYQLSKVLAEQKAWDLVNAHNAQPNQAHPVTLVTILPSAVLGPPIGSRVDGYSVNTLTDLLNGSLLDSGVYPSNFTDVDVRDVAAAHVAAAERKEASGRYILSSRDASTHLDYVELLRPSFPKRALPSKLSGPLFFQDYTVDNSRSIKELGIQYIPREKSVQDMLAKLIEIGLVTED